MNREHEKLKFYDVREETADDGKATGSNRDGIEPLSFDVQLRPAEKSSLRALLEDVMMTTSADMNDEIQAADDAEADVADVDVRKIKFTPELALQMVWTYIAKHKLCPQPADPNVVPSFRPNQLSKKQAKMPIQLDATLCDTLFKGVVKKGEAWPTECTLAQVYDLFLKQFLPQTTISRGGKKIVKNSEFNIHGTSNTSSSSSTSSNCVQISEEMKRGFKVTRISRFELFIIEATELSNLFSKKFASSCAVTELEGKANKDMYELTVQGWRADETAEILKSTFGVPVGCIKATRHRKNNT